MREEIALALDASAILLVAIGLWLAFQRRRWPGVLFGVLALVLMSGTAALRAYTILLWETQTMRLHDRLDGHTAPVETLALLTLPSS